MARPEITSIPNPARRNSRAPLVTGAILAGSLAAAAAGLAISRGQSQPIETPPPTSTGLVTEPSRTTPPVIIPPTEKPTPSPTEKPTEAPKALPEVINKDTVKFVVKSPEEVQKMIDEAKARGEEKIALPDVLSQTGVSIREIRGVNGRKLFAITAEKEENYSIVAETPGVVDQIIVSAPNKVSTFDAIMISQGKETWVHAVPDSASSQFKKGDTIKLGDTILSFKYDQKSPAGERFISYLNQQFPGSPNNTIVVLGHSGVDLSKENILRTPTGEVVLISSQK